MALIKSSKAPAIIRCNTKWGDCPSAAEADLCYGYDTMLQKVIPMGLEMLEPHLLQSRG